MVPSTHSRFNCRLFSIISKTLPLIVPILIGTRNTSVLKAIASGLQPWFNDRNLFIISSDFSHYPSYEDACRVDKLASDAILKGDPDELPEDHQDH